MLRVLFDPNISSYDDPDKEEHKELQFNSYVRMSDVKRLFKFETEDALKAFLGGDDDDVSKSDIIDGLRLVVGKHELFPLRLVEFHNKKWNYLHPIQDEKWNICEDKAEEPTRKMLKKGLRYE